MAVDTVVIVVSVLLSLAALLAIGFLIAMYIYRRRGEEHQIDAYTFDPARMEAGHEHDDRTSLDASRTHSSTWKEPLLPQAEPAYGYSYEKELERAQERERRGSWGSEDTYTNKYNRPPISTEENIPMMYARPPPFSSSSPPHSDMAYTPKPRSPPALPPLDTSASSLRTIRQPQHTEQPRSAAVLDVQSAGTSSPTRTASDTESLYSLPSAYYSEHDLHRNASIIAPPPVPPIPEQYKQLQLHVPQEGGGVAPLKPTAPLRPTRGFKSHKPQYSLDSEPSPLTRGDTRNVAQLLKARSRLQGEAGTDREREAELARQVSRIERRNSINGLQTPMTEVALSPR